MYILDGFRAMLGINGTSSESTRSSSRQPLKQPQEPGCLSRNKEKIAGVAMAVIALLVILQVSGALTGAETAIHDKVFMPIGQFCQEHRDVLLYRVLPGVAIGVVAIGIAVVAYKKGNAHFNKRIEQEVQQWVGTKGKKIVEERNEEYEQRLMRQLQRGEITDEQLKETFTSAVTSKIKQDEGSITDRVNQERLQKQQENEDAKQTEFIKKNCVQSSERQERRKIVEEQLAQLDREDAEALMVHKPLPPVVSLLHTSSMANVKEPVVVEYISKNGQVEKFEMSLEEGRKLAPQMLEKAREEGGRLNVIQQRPSSINRYEPEAQTLGRRVLFISRGEVVANQELTQTTKDPVKEGKSETGYHSLGIYPGEDDTH